MTRSITTLAVAIAAALTGTLLPVAPALAEPTPTVLFGGLNNPRGLAFGPDGDLYVAEAGTGGAGPCVDSPEGGQSCFGLTGSIARWKEGTLTRVFSGLPSAAGPDGSFAIGPSDVAFKGGKGLFTTGAELPLNAMVPRSSQMGRLYAFDAEADHPYASVAADLAKYEAKHNPDGGEIDSDPAGVAFGPGGAAVTDAAGNDLVGIRPDGSLRTLAVFPDTMRPAPPFLGLPDGTQIPVQAVPTGIVARGGAYYLTQLTGFPFEVGQAKIYRVVPGHQPTVVAEGLTNGMDLAFAEDGTLYALEIAHNGLLDQTPSGTLLKIVPGQAPEIILGGMTLPGGLTIRDGYAYVTDCGVCAGGGRVLQIKL